MASLSKTPALAERADLHKSCKSVETLLNILSEYCEAAGIVLSLQRKLAKALRDAATSKATAEIPSNALLASANVFESLSDVDAKFSKTLDKEYDQISDEVKKSFKKLTKEEKAHDEKMLVANAKLKQAGQMYEKKAKKKAADANEEHARYINLISTLGPEISQDKYNHAMTMTQRHTSMIYSVASCLARLADLEWQKSCECVRRFSPTVGPLCSLRSLCEGGWTGPIPPDLPDVSSSDMPTSPVDANTRLGAIQEVTEHQPISTDVNPEHASNSFDTLVANRQVQTSPNLISFPSASGDTLQPPGAPFVNPNSGSVRSLSAFPAPPTHFPLPAMRQEQQQRNFSPPTESSTSLLEFPSGGQLADSPISVHDDLISRDTRHALQSNSVQSFPPSVQERSYDGPLTTSEMIEAKSDQVYTRETSPLLPFPDRSQTSLSTESSQGKLYSPSRAVEIKPLNLKSYRDRDSPTTKEFGVLSNNPPSPTKSRTVDNFDVENVKYPRTVERIDTGTSTSRSIVATMRNRYDNNSGATSPPRDLPRLPLNINSKEGRHQNNEYHRSPSWSANSPPVSRQQSLPLLDAAARQAQESYATDPNISDHERNREILRRQKEQELRDREVDLEARGRELERDRAQLQALCGGGEHTGYVHDGNDTRRSVPGEKPGLHRQERRVSLRHQLRRPLSRMELDEVPSPTRAQESYTQHLIPPADNLHTPPLTLQPTHSPKPSHPSPLLQCEGHLQESRTLNQSPGDVSHSYTSTSTSSVHASFCGCEKCSISKYREPPREQQNSPNESRRSEKSRLGTGWIRRLSMPVSNIKKHQSNSTIGVANTHSLGSGIVGGVSNKGMGLFSLDSKKNMSTTGLGGVDEDGKLGRPGGVVLNRRSFDPSGMSNRSMTNLKLR